MPRSLMLAANLRGANFSRRSRVIGLSLSQFQTHFELAVRTKKVARVTVEEFERESEEAQRVLWGWGSS